MDTRLDPELVNFFSNPDLLPLISSPFCICNTFENQINKFSKPSRPMEYHIIQMFSSLFIVTFSSLFPVRNNFAEMILPLKDGCHKTQLNCKPSLRHLRRVRAVDQSASICSNMLPSSSIWRDLPRSCSICLYEVRSLAIRFDLSLYFDLHRFSSIFDDLPRSAPYVVVRWGLLGLCRGMMIERTKNVEKLEKHSWKSFSLLVSRYFTFDSGNPPVHPLVINLNLLNPKHKMVGFGFQILNLDWVELAFSNPNLTQPNWCSGLVFTMFKPHFYSCGLV